MADFELFYRYTEPIYATPAQLKDASTSGCNQYEIALKGLSPFQTVQLDFAVWLARCIGSLDDTFALVDQMPVEDVPVALPANAKAYRHVVLSPCLFANDVEQDGLSACSMRQLCGSLCPISNSHRTAESAQLR
jgi:hypothetical protein